jgi:hypothetical protein
MSAYISSALILSLMWRLMRLRDTALSCRSVRKYVRAPDFYPLLSTKKSNAHTSDMLITALRVSQCAQEDRIKYSWVNTVILIVWSIAGLSSLLWAVVITFCFIGNTDLEVWRSSFLLCAGCYCNTDRIGLL